MSVLGRVAFYLRLSLADGDLGGGKDESNSIENQRSLLRDYLLRRAQREKEMPEGGPLPADCLRGICEYVDDGYSGTNFDRPGFRRMIEDAKRRRIDTILVKDLSRLGRDYIEVGDYMEQIFPRLGIRLIAVGTGYDSAQHPANTVGLETCMTNLIHAEYSRDLSRKVTSARHAQWSRGMPTVGTAPFGYRMAGRHYAVDAEAAAYVRLIFQQAAQGWTTAMIANHLNQQHIPVPGKYRRERTGRDCPGRRVADAEWLWDTAKVRGILRNYSYTGNLVQGKTRPIAPCSRTRRRVQRQEQYILHQAHEAIVSEELWEAAQTAIRTTRAHYGRSPQTFVLRGKVRCGSCGLAMAFQEATRTFYCAHGVCVGRASVCDTRRYSEAWVCSAVREALDLRLDTLETLTRQIEADRAHPAREAEQRAQAHQLEQLRSEKLRRYEAYAAGETDREEFLRQRDALDGRARALEAAIARCAAAGAEARGLLQALGAVRRTRQRLEASRGESPLSRPMAEEFIETVWIQGGGRIRTVFTFDALCERAAHYLGRP